MIQQCSDVQKMLLSRLGSLYHPIVKGKVFNEQSNRMNNRIDVRNGGIIRVDFFVGLRDFL